MLWDCQFCGTQKLLAKTHPACPKCKAPQDPTWRYFPSDADKIAVENYEFKGKDKTCAACNSLNKAESKFCMRCGAPLDDAEAAPTVASREGSGTFVQQNLKANLALQRQQRIQAEALARGGRMPAKSSGVKTLVNRSSATEKLAMAAMGGMGCISFGPLLLMLIALASYGLLSLWKEPTVVEVTGHRWVRTIEIETYKSQSKSDWKGAVPSDANGISCQRRQKDTKQVADGETCTTRQVDQGDGTFREEKSCTTDYRSEPIYGSYCSYTVNRWQSGGPSSVASGNNVADTPHWPTPSYNSCSSTKLGCQRQGARRETYTLNLVDRNKGKQHTCNMNFSDWKMAPVGTQFDAKVGKLVGGVNCKRMQRR